jgi:hypothetical protein
MKKYCKIFFFLFFITSFGITAKCADANNSLPPSHLTNSPSILHSCSALSMNGNKPTTTHQLLLFRNGVDEKGILLSYYPYKNSASFSAIITDNYSINSGRIKYVLTFSDLLILPPEFLSSSSFRSPPVLC